MTFLFNLLEKKKKKRKRSFIITEDPLKTTKTTSIFFSFPGAIREEQLMVPQARFCGCSGATLYSCSVPYTTNYFLSEMLQILPLPGVFPSALRHVNCISGTSLLPSITVFYPKILEKIVKYVRNFWYIFYYITYVHSLTMFHGHIHHFSKIKGF